MYPPVRDGIRIGDGTLRGAQNERSGVGIGGGTASTSFRIDPVEEIIGVFMIQIVPEAREIVGIDFLALTG